MNRSTLSALAAASLVGSLTGCDLYGPSVDIKPALSMNGKSVVGDAAQQYEAGKRYLAQQRFAAAAQSFQAALLAGGRSVDVLNALAVAYDNLSRYDLSEEIYRQALALDAQNPQTLNNYGVSLARQGMPDKAALVLAQAKADAPDNPTVMANLDRLGAVARAEPSASKAEVSDVDLPPPAPALPRVEHVGVGTLALITRETPRVSGPQIGTRAPSPTVPVAPPAVSIELASAPSAVNPVVVVAETAAPTPKSVATVAETDRSIRKLRPPRVEVANGAGRNRMAARMRSFLKTEAIPVKWLTNDRSFHHPKTVIQYRPGFEAAARELAHTLPVGVEIAESTSLRGDIRLCLGHDLMAFDLALWTAGNKHEA